MKIKLKEGDSVCERLEIAKCSLIIYIIDEYRVDK